MDFTKEFMNKLCFSLTKLNEWILFTEISDFKESGSDIKWYLMSTIKMEM